MLRKTATGLDVLILFKHIGILEAWNRGINVGQLRFHAQKMEISPKIVDFARGFYEFWCYATSSLMWLQN